MSESTMMLGQYWINWTYSEVPGHTPGATAYNTANERDAIVADRARWRSGCYPSSTFETDNKGDVI